MIECLLCGKIMKDEGPHCDCPPKIVTGIDFSKVWKPDFIPLIITRDHSKMLDVQPMEIKKDLVYFKKSMYESLEVGEMIFTAAGWVDKEIL